MIINLNETIASLKQEGQTLDDWTSKVKHFLSNTLYVLNSNLQQLSEEEEQTA